MPFCGIKVPFFQLLKRNYKCPLKLRSLQMHGLIVARINKDRTDELDLSLIAKDFVHKNDRRLRFFGNFE